MADYLTHSSLQRPICRPVVLARIWTIFFSSVCLPLSVSVCLFVCLSVCLPPPPPPPLSLSLCNGMTQLCFDYSFFNRYLHPTTHPGLERHTNLESNGKAQLDVTTVMDADNTYGKADIPICSVCDNISLECSSLSACSHPACPKCVAMVSLGTTVLTTCKVCAQQPKQRSADISENHDQADESKCDGGLPTGTPGEPNNTERDLRNKKLITRQDRVEESATVSPRSETQLHSLRDKAQGLRHQDRTSAEKVDEISILGRTEAAAVPGRRLPNAPAMTSVVRAYLEEAERSDELSDSVAKIQEAMMLATKYSHCSNCLQDKKSRSPDLLCLDCSLSFCTR